MVKKWQNSKNMAKWQKNIRIVKNGKSRINNYFIKEKHKYFEDKSLSFDLVPDK